jgi:cell division initiation protein
MENQEMKITPQDIIDKEFKVKFRGFDMAEVDAFLGEVAENFFKLSEENTLLNEKILALQQELETGTIGSQVQQELPAELGNLLEDLRQDTAAIGTELAALKQDRQIFDSLEKNLKTAVTSSQELVHEVKSQGQHDISADVRTALEGFKQDAAAVAAELAALKQEGRALEAIKAELEEIMHSAREAASLSASREGGGGIPADLDKTLADFKQGTEKIETELAAIKEELGTIPGMREEITKEVQALLTSHFEKLEARLSTGGGTLTQPPPQPGKASQVPPPKEELLAAEVIEEPEGHYDEKNLPNYRPEEEETTEEEGELEFLSEDDILDVDKLRGIFQSVLDEGVSDGHESRYGDETTADLLFLDDDFIEDEHEPEVTFSLDETIDKQKTKPKK